MATQLSIVNGVLNELGETAVSNISDSEHATIIDQKVDLAYRRSLTDTNWTFAQEFVSLAKTTDTGIPNFPFVYQLPVGFQRLVKTDNLTDYTILKDKIYSIQDTSINIFYIESQISFNLWPSEFESYIIYKVASESSLVLTNDVSLTEYLKKEALSQKNNAIYDNSNREGFRDVIRNKYDRKSQVL
jgi:hypothetical protein